MGLYRKKPVVIEAYQFAGGLAEPGWPAGWVGDNVAIDPSGEYVLCRTLEGTMRGDKGDWIIKGISGEFYPCKPDIFAKTYEVAL